MEKWRADGGEEKLKAAKKAAKRAEKAASSPKKKAGGGECSFTNSTKISVLFSYLHNVLNQTHSFLTYQILVMLSKSYLSLKF